MRFLILFLFLMSNAFADEIQRIKNLVVNKMKLGDPDDSGRIVNT